MRPRMMMAAGSVIFLLGLHAVPAAAAGPTIERGRFQERFFDDYILEACGIETYTTWTQVFSVKTFPNGAEHVHVVRTFDPDDPRLPIEKGAATAFVAPDGTRTVVGKPLQIIGPDGGVRLVDAGWVQFGDEIVMHGHHPVRPWIDDLAPYYCPPDV